jgi:hypothetical protein
MTTGRTFHVERTPGADPRSGPGAGRVEHLTWGERTHFESRAELGRFIRTVDRTATPRACGAPLWLGTRARSGC